MHSFAEFDLLPTILKTLAERDFKKPTEIQSRAIPKLLAGKQIVGIAETGSGKTLAYALPIVHMLKKLELDGNTVLEDASPRAIIMVPTRELGEQIAKVFKTLTHDTRLRVRPALGGMTMEQTRRNVSGAFEILLATPGRLVQLLEMNALDLSGVRTIVFDEADQMLDDGFLPDSKIVVARAPSRVQLVMFSATISPSVQKLIDALFQGVEVARSSGSGKVVKTLTTKNLQVENGKRWPLLEKILAEPSTGGTILFVNTRDQCDRLAEEMRERGFLCGVYRGELDKVERRQTLKAFREGQTRFLVSTDLGGRGLDIEDVDRVINYVLPQQMENYLHRVGRTARAGRDGVVYNLITERDEQLISDLRKEKLIERERVSHEDRVAAEAPAPREEFVAMPRKAGSRPFTPMPLRSDRGGRSEARPSAGGSRPKKATFHLPGNRPPTAESRSSGPRSAGPRTGPKAGGSRPFASSARPGAKPSRPGASGGPRPAARSSAGGRAARADKPQTRR